MSSHKFKKFWKRYLTKCFIQFKIVVHHLLDCIFFIKQKRDHLKIVLKLYWLFLFGRCFISSSSFKKIKYKKLFHSYTDDEHGRKWVVLSEKDSMVRLDVSNSNCTCYEVILLLQSNFPFDTQDFTIYGPFLLLLIFFAVILSVCMRMPVAAVSHRS